MASKTKRLMIVAIVLLLVSGVSLGTFFAYTCTKKSVYDEAIAVMHASANEQCATLEMYINGKMSVLNGLAYSIEKQGKLSGEQIGDYLSAALGDNAQIYFAFADNANKTFGSVNNWGNAITGMLDCSRVEKTSMLSVCNDDGEYGVAISVPVYYDNTPIGMLCEVCLEKDIRALLTTDIYNSSSYSLIIDLDGNVVIGSENGSTVPGSENEPSFLNASELGPRQEIISDITNGHIDSVQYSEDGKTVIAAFSVIRSEVIPENDWIIVNTVDSEALTSAVNKTWQGTIVALVVFSLFAIVAIVLFIMLEHENKRKIDAETENLRQSEEKYKIAVAQGARTVMQYNIETGTMYRDDDAIVRFGGEKICKKYVDEIISMGIVTEESEADFRAYFAKLCNDGAHHATADFLLCENDGSLHWYRFDATVMNSDSKTAAYAIISFFDCTELREREQAYAKWRQDILEMSGEDMALFEWNLTREILETKRGGLVEQFVDLPRTSFDKHNDTYAEKSVYSDDRAEFVSMLLRERLIDAYYNGIYHDSMEYREVLANGKLRWMSLTVQLVPYSDNDEIKIYIILRNIDEEKKKELTLIEKSQLDIMTGLYNRDTFIQRVNELIKLNPDGNHALFMVDIDGFKGVNDILGHDAGDKTLIDIANSLRSVMRISDIVGRVGGDEFMIFMPDIPFDAAISKRAEELCGVLRKHILGHIKISASIGIAVYPRDGISFNELYLKADAAQYHIKNGTRDDFAFYTDGMKESSSVSEIDNETSSEVYAINSVVMIACDDDESIARISDVVDIGYTTVVARSIAELRECAQTYMQTIFAVIINADTEFGNMVMSELRSDIYKSNPSILALANKVNDEMLLKVVLAGASVVIPKHNIGELLPLRLKFVHGYWYSEQRRVQEAYRRLQTIDEIRYREVLRVTGMTVIIYDVMTGTYQADLLSLNASRSDFTGTHLGDGLIRSGTMEEKDVENVRELIYNITNGKVDRASYNAQITTKNGDKRWFFIQISRIDGVASLTQKLIITASDISDRMNAEQEREKILDNLPCGAAMYGVSNNSISTIYINKRYMELVGRKDEKIYVDDAMEAVLPSDRSRLYSCIGEAIKSGGISSCNIHIIDGDGVYAPFMVTGRAVRTDTNSSIIYATYFPIDNELVVNMESLLPRLLSAVLESSTDLMFVKDCNYNYICASRAFAQITAYKNESDIVGKSDYDLFDKEFADKYREDDISLVQGNKALINFVEQIPDLDGKHRFSLTSKFMLNDSMGKPTALYGIGRDITKIVENNRLQKITELATRLAFECVCILYTETGEYEMYGTDSDSMRGIDKSGSYADLITAIAINCVSTDERADFIAMNAMSTLIENMEAMDGRYSYNFTNVNGTRLKSEFHYYEETHTEIVMTVRKITD